METIVRSTGEWQRADLENYLHPFNDYKALLDEKVLVITRGEGCYVWDSDNNRYLDGRRHSVYDKRIGEICGLTALCDAPMVGEVRSSGMIAAVELVRDNNTMVMLCPPLIISEQEIDYLVEKMYIALEGFEKTVNEVS